MSNGRPKLDIDRAELSQHIKAGKSQTEIAEEYGITRKTLRRILVDHGIITQFRYNSDLTDEDIDRETENIKCLMPFAGERLIIGHFRSLGIMIQRHRIRSSIHRVDNAGVEERIEYISHRISRRVYGSPFPHHCWHLDGNHRLIRWGLVVHCAIDGFSRACTFINCSNNNRSTTVMQHFLVACEEFCVPWRVRTDSGGENQLIWEGMLELATENNPNPVLVGPSVHNQRVERFNRDINTHVRERYGHMFYSFERRGLLDIENPIHVAALHYVYMPRINAVLSALKRCHNHHPISTEHNLSPMQLIARNISLYECPSHEDIAESDRTTDGQSLPQNPVSVDVNPPDLQLPNIDEILDVDVLDDDGVDGERLFTQVRDRLLALGQ